MAITVNTPEDYTRLAAEQLAALQVIQAKATAEDWTMGQMIEAFAQAELPYMQAFTDPNNAVAIRMERELADKGNAEQGIQSRPLAEGEQPELQQTIAGYVSKLNKMYGVDYPVPQIILSTGLQERSEGSPASYSIRGDQIEIDPVALQQNPQMLESMLAHELGHRYQRTPANYMTHSKMSYFDAFDIELDDKTLAEIRVMEGISDFRAAQLTSPQQTAQMLRDVFTVTGTVYMQFLQEKLGTGEGISKILAAYNSKTPEQQAALQQEFLTLQPEQFNALFTHALAIDAKYTQGAHPAYSDRLDFMRILQNDPSLLQQNSLPIDDQENIIAAPGYTPAQLEQISKDADKVVGIRR